MALTYDEYVQKMATILENVSDAGLVSELLTDLRGNYSEVMETIDLLSAEKEALQKSNASLIEANGKLFMQVGVTTKEEVAETIPKEEESATIEEVLSVVLDEKGRF